MIGETLRAAGFDVRPYHAYVPSFGDWGFTLASRSALGAIGALPEDWRYFSPAEEQRMIAFPADMRAERARQPGARPALHQRMEGIWR